MESLAPSYCPGPSLGHCILGWGLVPSSHCLCLLLYAYLKPVSFSAMLLLGDELLSSLLYEAGQAQLGTKSARRRALSRGQASSTEMEWTLAHPSWLGCSSWSFTSC